MTHTLKIATLNIWNKSGPWSDRLPLIRGELAVLAPDVLGLQEVLRLEEAGVELTTDRDQATEIADGLGYEIAYGAATHYGSGLQFGNAILSRHPVTESRVFPLPGEESGETRSLLYALIATPHGDMPVFVTHLNWKLHHGSIRMRQVRCILRHVFELCPVDEARLPPVLMGDFNAEPESDEIRHLRGLCAVDGETVYFADAWVAGGDGSYGATFDRRNRFAALAHEPPRRIDYIFVRGPDRKFRGEPLSTRLAFATPTGDVWPSDHFGLLTEIAATAREA